MAGVKCYALSCSFLSVRHAGGQHRRMPSWVSGVLAGGLAQTLCAWVAPGAIPPHIEEFPRVLPAGTPDVFTAATQASFALPPRNVVDPTRRAVLQRLSSGTAPVTQLAEPFDMAYAFDAIAGRAAGASSIGEEARPWRLSRNHRLIHRRGPWQYHRKRGSVLGG